MTNRPIKLDREARLALLYDALTGVTLTDAEHALLRRVIDWDTASVERLAGIFAKAAAR